MIHPHQSTPDIEFRRYYDMVFDGTQSFDAWMKRNRLAFHALNPQLAEHDEPAAFRFWMMETYEGQFAQA